MMIRLLAESEKRKIEEILRPQGCFFVVGGSICSDNNENYVLHVTIEGAASLTSSAKDKICQTIKEEFGYIDEVELI